MQQRLALFQISCAKLIKMVRLSLPLVLALMLILAGVAIAYDAITRRDTFPLVGSALAIGLGLVWLWVIIKEWDALGE